SWNANGAVSLLLARMARYGIIAGRPQPPPAPPAVSVDGRLNPRRHHRRPARETSRDDLPLAAPDRRHDGYPWAFFMGCRLVWLKKAQHRRPQFPRRPPDRAKPG